MGRPPPGWQQFSYWRSFVLWWRFLAADFNESLDIVYAAAALTRAGCGTYASRRRWWLVPVPRAAFFGAGFALSLAYSDARPGGAWFSDRDSVQLLSFLGGLIATGALVTAVIVQGGLDLLLGESRRGHLPSKPA